MPSPPPPSADPTTDLAAELPPPPPGAALSAALANLTPVSTRRPGRILAGLFALAAAIAFFVLWGSGLRPDWQALPRPWLIGMVGVWAAAGPFLLALTVLPVRGNVLPDAGRAARAAIGVGLALVVLGLFATVDAEGATRHASSFAKGWWHCTRFGLLLVVPILVGGVLFLRHVHPVGAGRIAWALGAAGGAWAGFMLQLVCPLGGGAHVGFAHGGVTFLGGALGLFGLSRLLR
jgi:Negative regulator of sigma F